MFRHLLRRRDTFVARPRARLASASAVALVGAVFALSGCGEHAQLRQPRIDPTVVRYDDLVTDGVRLGDGGSPRLMHCADQTRFARPLAPGRPMTMTLQVGEEPVLVVAACRPEPGLGGTVQVSVRAAEGAPITAGTPLPETPSWQRLEVDLGPLAGDEAEIRITVEGTAGHPVIVSDAWVRHRCDRPVAWTGAEAPLDTSSSAPPRTPAKRSSAKPAPGPRIILVSIDALRYDAVDLTSEADGPTPSLARFAAGGEVFTVHRPGASWTKPSHATMLTGYPTSVHGADRRKPLPAALPRLPARLRDAGLSTAAVVYEGVWLSRKLGFDVGFESYRSVPWDTAQIGRAAVNWIGANRDRPFFFFFHTFDAHSDFRQLPYESDTATTRMVAELFGIEEYGCRHNRCASAYLRFLGTGGAEPLPREDEILRDLYRRGVADVDRDLGRFFDDLEALGVFDEALIIVTSDHGELLLEHGATLHGNFWEPVLRVPLIVKWPQEEKRAALVTEAPTTALDIAPTVLAVSGLPTQDLPGSDLRQPPPDRPLFVRHTEWWAVYEGRYKAVFPSAGETRLFDLQQDPAETTNLRDEQPSVVQRLREHLRTFEAWSVSANARLLPGDATDEQQLTRDEVDRLRALGYVD